MKSTKRYPKTNVISTLLKIPNSFHLYKKIGWLHKKFMRFYVLLNKFQLVQAKRTTSELSKKSTVFAVTRCCAQWRRSNYWKTSGVFLPLKIEHSLKTLYGFRTTICQDVVAQAFNPSIQRAEARRSLSFILARAAEWDPVSKWHKVTKMALPIFQIIFRKKSIKRTREMALWVKTFATKPDDLFLRPILWKERTDLAHSHANRQNLKSHFAKAM